MMERDERHTDTSWISSLDTEIRLSRLVQTSETVVATNLLSIMSLELMKQIGLKNESNILPIDLYTGVEDGHAFKYFNDSESFSFSLVVYQS